ncbi:MAG: serine/threonine protein kinase [Polyangiaceae bacterium]|nr:serine/threonine protein kinase [Polyangiaceae bacterium]
MVGQLIGDGQYGSVYECIGPFDQPYALKMLRPANKPYEVVKEEWATEMKRLESYRHPNIVYIHDAFEVNFLFYLALEKCDTSLRALLQMGPLSPPLMVEITRQLLLALQYLHDAGLVHSDLHSGNVLLSQVDRWPIVKLTDFGVAHQLEGQHWFRPRVANPKILTPELVMAGYTTRQSDLYQLGLLMFHMHTGRSATSGVDDANDVTGFIQAGTPRALADALGTPFSPVISKLLRRREGYRYQSGREVWEDLRKCIWW